MGEDFLYLFELSLGIVLSIYNKEALLGFLPHEGFPKINDVSLVIVYFSLILSYVIVIY